MTYDTKSIAKNLKHLKVTKGVTLQAIADGTELSTDTISGYLYAGHCPNVSSLLALAKYFNVSPERILAE